jgi:hypothetical protein
MNGMDAGRGNRPGPTPPLRSMKEKGIQEGGKIDRKRPWEARKGVWIGKLPVVVETLLRAANAVWEPMPQRVVVCPQTQATGG